MLAYYLHTLSPFIFKFGDNFGMRWYGFAYVMAFLCGYFLYQWLSRQGYSEIPQERVGDFITWAALFGVMLGGRLGYVLLYKFDEYARHPLDIFKIWDGGMSSHGGMAGLILFTFFYSRRHGYSWTSVGDNLCVVAPIGLFFGRIANFINGELYGQPSLAPWAIQFPKELYDLQETPRFLARFEPGANVDSIIAQAPHDPQIQQSLREILTPRHPSQLYEALLEGVVLFCALWVLRTKIRLPRGVITGAFFVIYAIVRIIGENFRVPDAPMTGPLTRGQFLSLFLIIIGAVFIVVGLVKRRYEFADLRGLKP